jgi:L,D-peptidoglycan transpeptidase YkuD (ErfK/YbiS/YcfS/YnhG family)
MAKQGNMRPYLIAVAFVVVALVAVALCGRRLRTPIRTRLMGRRTVEDAVTDVRAQAEQRLKPYFTRVKVTYPPSHISLLICKLERRVELWVRSEGAWTPIKQYTVTAASGRSGPKLKEGDRQVPEGVYQISALNPNSAWHLSLKIDYPNAFDRRMARAEGRSDLGGDIFIHGGAASIGCVAVGDPAIEELFVLAADARPAQIAVLIMPNDLRGGQKPRVPKSVPIWTTELYEGLRKALSTYQQAE